MFWYDLLLSLSVGAFPVDTVVMNCEIEIPWLGFYVWLNFQNKLCSVLVLF